MSAFCRPFERHLSNFSSGPFLYFFFGKTPNRVLFNVNAILSSVMFNRQCKRTYVSYESCNCSYMKKIFTCLQVASDDKNRFVYQSFICTLVILKSMKFYFFIKKILKLILRHIVNN